MSRSLIRKTQLHPDVFDLVYTTTEINTLLSDANSHVIYVDKHKQTALARDGSRARPFASVRDAFTAIGNAADSTQFNDINLRYWAIKVAAGSYDETAGGDLQVPKRFFVKLDLSDGASIIGNLVRDLSGNLVVGWNNNPVFLIEGSSNRPFYEAAHSRTQIGVRGNISMVNGENGGTNALHLFAVGVRKVEYSADVSAGTPGQGHFFANQNSTWDTLFSSTLPVTLYCVGTRNSTGNGTAGNVIGNIFINPIYDTYWLSNKSIFTVNQVFFRFDEDVVPPPYIERRATSFTRSSNQATVTIAGNHGLSLSPATDDGYVPEQYIIINGVSENTSFNTPLYGAKVISYPTANTVIYESPGVNVTTSVQASNSKLIRGTFLGNALVGGNLMGANGRASENAAMTFPSFANATELGQGSASLLGFAKGVSYSNPLTSWAADTILPKNTILILNDQFQYRTTTNVGRTASVQPTFPTTLGATVQDGFVTWVCEQNALDRTLPSRFNVQSKLEQLSNAKNIYLKSSMPAFSSLRNVQDAIETLAAVELVIACSDETTNLTTGTAKVTFRAPHAFILTAVRGSLSTAQASGSVLTVDVKKGGTSVFSTNLTFDNNEKTTTTAAIPAVISDSAIANDAEITIDIVQVGTAGAKGLKVTLIGTRA